MFDLSVFLHLSSVVRDQQSSEFSQGNLAKKAAAYGMDVADLRLPPVEAVAASVAKEREWANVVTTHRHCPHAYTWSAERKALGAHKLGGNKKTKSRTSMRADEWNASPAPSDVTAVCMSPCGNFAFLGLRNGRVEKYNVQSGVIRGVAVDHYANDATKPTGGGDGGDGGDGTGTASSSGALASKSRKRKAGALDGPGGTTTLSRSTANLHESSTAKRAHVRTVTGIVTDTLNTVCITASLDGVLKVWDFTKLTLLHRLNIGTGVNRVSMHRESDLLAVAGDDHAVIVVDIAARRIVRRFPCGRSPVVDMCFSPDGRWLVIASVDAVRVYDLPSYKLVDWFRFAKPLTSVSFSPKGDFLATTHVQTLGTFLWANKAHFARVAMQQPAAAIVMDLPSSASFLARADTSGAAAAAAHVDEHVHIEVGDVFDDVMNDDDDNDDDDDYDSGEDDGDRFGFPSAVFSTSTPVDENGVPCIKALHQRVSIESSSAAASSQSGGTAGGAPAVTAPLITLSGVSRAVWTDLDKLDVIRQRNAPKQAPKKPVLAPFFLASAADVNGFEVKPDAKALGLVEDVVVDDAAARRAAARSRIVKSGAAREKSSLIRAAEADVELANGASLADANKTANIDATAVDAGAVASSRVLQLLKGMGASSLDAALQEVGAHPAYEVEELAVVLDAFALALQRREDFEFVQAVMHRFLQLHGGTISSNEPLVARLRRLRRHQTRLWRRLESALHSTLCLLSHMSHVQM
jgi:hypothetical protein